MYAAIDLTKSYFGLSIVYQKAAWPITGRVITIKGCYIGHELVKFTEQRVGSVQIYIDMKKLQIFGLFLNSFSMLWCPTLFKCIIQAILQ